MTTSSTDSLPAIRGPVTPLGDRDPYGRFRRDLLSAARVRELSQLRPLRVVRDTALSWGLIAAAWLAVALRPEWWVVPIAMVVVGTRYYALFIIGHDGMHRRLFRQRWLNDLWNDVLCQGPIGAVTHINNRNHLRHHQHLATEADPDRHKHACFNKADHGEVVGFLSGLRGLWRSVRNVYRPDREDVVQRAELETDGGHTPRDAAILVGVQLALAIGLTAGIGWWAYPVLWLAPVYLFTYLGDNFRSFAEHSQPRADGPADEHRLITYVSNPVERWFVAPMNMNYHAAHHLWPSIPYYNLPAADRAMRAMPAAAGLEWRRSYLGYLARYWLALPLEECRRA